MSGILTAIVAAAALMGASGVLCTALPRRAGGRDALFAVLMAAGGAVGIVSAVACLVTGTESTFESTWLLPIGRLALRLDMLSVMFLMPVFLVPALGAVFGVAYWRERDHAATAPRLRVFYGMLPASMVSVILAQDGVFLLIAWEVMALAAFFVIAAEDSKREVRDAAWVYLVATHIGTLALLAFFTRLSSATGSFDLVPLGPETAAGGAASGLFLLGLVGFGVKAGIMPIHVWLPGAHANAPSHVSAVLSGVMLKVGVYGLFRLCWLLPPGPLWWSWILIGLGAVSAVLGIAFALSQHDYKRVLAYSSIENVGIIVLALGIAMLGRTTANPALTALGLAGALLHVWNHSVFKPLLFFVAGALLHACHTRRMNALGGLWKRMPATAGVAVVGCIAIAALPPLNGFASEWLVYRAVVGGLAFGPAGSGSPLAVALVAMALTGSLALATFVKFFGTLFLGQERTNAAAGAHDPCAAMLVPMGILAGLCFAVGALPRLVLVPIEHVVRMWTGNSPRDAAGLAAAIGGLGTASIAGTAAAGGALVLALWLRARARNATESSVGTWDCGYATPSARMQYNESSFGELVGRLFEGILIPQRQQPSLDARFPTASAYRSETPDVVLDRGLLPLLASAARLLMSLRLVQQGQVQVYVSYILFGLIVLLVVAR